MIKSLDPLGEVLTKKEIKFLAEIFTDAWYSAPIVIELEDGQALIPQADDEGNDGGALWIANSKCLDDLAPVIRG